MRNSGVIVLVTFGYGGHTEYRTDNSRLSGYDVAKSWRPDPTADYSGAIVVDQTTMDDSALRELAISGPMVDPMLPDNSVSYLAGPIRPYTVGCARALDYVSRDVWVTMATMGGARAGRVDGDHVVWFADQDELYEAL